MLQPEQRELLKQMSHSMHGRALKAFLDEQYKIIGDITSCTSWEQTVGRQFAIGVLKDIFSFLEEKPETPKTPNQYT
jgi:hypothetical protein